MDIKAINRMNYVARNMLLDTVENRPRQLYSVSDFFAMAENKPMLGVLSFHTELNKLGKYGVKRQSKPIPNQIEEIIELIPMGKIWANNFTEKLNQLYPKTLADRIAIAKFGAVRSDDNVVIGRKGMLHRHTFMEKFMISLNKNIRELKYVLTH